MHKVERIQITTKSNYAKEESFRILRTNLQFCGTDVKTILITSAFSEEGKSTCAYNLAESFAELGKKVLIMDCDLRKSVMLSKFRSDSRVYGLTHYLTGMQTLENTICETDVRNLHILFAGAFPPNPAELLSTKSFSLLLNVMREHYDYIIVDAPPIGSVIDAAILAQFCDGALLVISQKKIKYRMAQKVKEQIERSNCRILGVVLNSVEHDRGMFGKGYYGRYYNHYYGDHYGEYYRSESLKQVVTKGSEEKVKSEE